MNREVELTAGQLQAQRLNQLQDEEESFGIQARPLDGASSLPRSSRFSISCAKVCALIVGSGILYGSYVVGKGGEDVRDNIDWLTVDPRNWHVFKGSVEADLESEKTNRPLRTQRPTEVKGEDDVPPSYKPTEAKADDVPPSYKPTEAKADDVPPSYKPTEAKVEIPVETVTHSPTILIEKTSSQPSSIPSDVPSSMPSEHPSHQPSSIPSQQPSSIPSQQPSSIPTAPFWSPPDNPHLSFLTPDWTDFVRHQWEERVENSIKINEMYGSYCKDGAMCPPLDPDGHILNPELLDMGPTVSCNNTGAGGVKCGVGTPWLNKTIWPLIRGPLCVKHDKARREQHPLPDELVPYYELGYDRVDPTRSKDAEPFPITGDYAEMKHHFLKLEAMLVHYYEGVGRSFLEMHISPSSASPLYGDMLQAYADQISRVILRSKANGTSMVIGVLGDSVTAGQDNCYYDAWPEVLRRQIAPLFEAMGIQVDVRNAGKNGGHSLPSQMMCAYDMLGAADTETGLDFLFVQNPFVSGDELDAEHLIRRALFGKDHTVVSINSQGKNFQVNALLSTYAAAGLTIANIFSDSSPEIGYPKDLHFWFPEPGRAFWGMQGDGFCPLTTRSGSSSVVNRNWHWGPKLHQTFADAYALLLGRAAIQALDDLSLSITPPAPPNFGDIDSVLEPDEEKPDNPPPSWKTLLKKDMFSESAMEEGLGGVRCAVGLANQPASTLLPHWLRPVLGSPFEVMMTARNGVSFVPIDHDSDGHSFYDRGHPISTPNSAVDVGKWVPLEQLKGFSPEAPRTAEQCMHVDGYTKVKGITLHPADAVSWLVWEIPKGIVSVGRSMICHPRNGKPLITEDALEKGDVRFHYSVLDGQGGWKVFEDVQKVTPVNFFKQECTPIVVEMDDDSLKSAREGGMWVAVERKANALFPFDYLVAI